MRVQEKKCRLPLLAFLILLLILPVTGCPMYTAVGFKYAESSEGEDEGQILGDDPDGIEIKATTVTLAWDAPSPEIDYYRVLFRIHDASPPAPWLILEEDLNAAESPEYTLVENYGIFDFGVVAKDLDSETEESALHSSLDITAQPDTGWYLIWMAP